MERKYGWFLKVVKDFTLPIVILATIATWLAFRVEDKFNTLEQKMEIHQEFLRQICVNTSPDWSRQRECWNIRMNGK